MSTDLVRLVVDKLLQSILQIARHKSQIINNKVFLQRTFSEKHIDR